MARVHVRLLGDVGRVSGSADDMAAGPQAHDGFVTTCPQPGGAVAVPVDGGG
jgi:hypothetical protein